MPSAGRSFSSPISATMTGHAMYSLGFATLQVPWLCWSTQQSLTNSGGLSGMAECKAWLLCRRLGKAQKDKQGESRQSCAHRVSVNRPWHEGDKSSSWNSHMHKEIQFPTYQYNPGLLSVQGSYCSQT